MRATGSPFSDSRCQIARPIANSFVGWVERLRNPSKAPDGVRPLRGASTHPTNYLSLFVSYLILFSLLPPGSLRRIILPFPPLEGVGSADGRTSAGEAPGSARHDRRAASCSRRLRSH